MITVRRVGTTLANPSVNRVFRGRGKTAFERNLLPGFARWMLDEIERREPDYLIPVETKGARILEAVSRFARDELGEPLPVPVVYASALAYMDPDELSASRMMIVDDAVRTGGSLLRHRRRVERYGATVIEALACVGDAAQSHPGADCYRSVSPDAYREHVWQLAELVVARGLPPEVDHHLFELRLPGRLETSWWALKALLREHGTITVDAADIEGEALQPVTLHFPDFPGICGPGSDAPHKLRFFPDPLNDSVYVVPVSFPPVELPEPTEGANRPPETWQYQQSVARNLVASFGCPGPLGEVLVDEAEVLDPDTIFAVASTAVEFELVRGLKALLERGLSGSAIRFQTDQYARLYGPRAFDTVVAAVDAGLADAALPPPPAAPDPAAPEAFAEQTPFLDHGIAQATKGMADNLRKMHEEEKGREPVFPPRRVGLSMVGLTELVGDRLRASRCVDYGLAMTTLVPFVDYERTPSGLLLERKYRVSEPREDERRPYGDMTEVREALSAEMLASICFCVSERSRAYRGSALDPELLSSLVGILRGLVCEDHSIELRVLPAPGHEQIVLCADDRPLTLDDHGGDMLSVDEEGVRATDRFRKEWTANQLRLDERKSTESIEDHVSLLIELLDEMERAEHRELLRAWAMCSDGRLGLTHVRSSLDAALAAAARALKQVKSEERHSPAGVASSAHTEAAREKLRVLRKDWASPVRDRWGDENELKRRKRMIRTLGAPRPELGAYAIPTRLVALVEAVAHLAEQVNNASARLWDEEPAASDSTVPAAVLEACARVRATLSDLDGDFEPATPPDDPREALGAAAEELQDVLELIRAFVAATAALYRGFWDGHRRPLGEERRTVSVLSVDLAGSSDHGHDHPAPEHRKWVSDGLNMAAQWSRAFTGREGKAREGDEVWVEFPPGDAAVVCAAAILQHAAALRSTGIADVDWRFHIGCHTGELEDDDGNNVVAHAMNKVTKLARACDAEADRDVAHLTPEALQVCSPELADGSFATREERVDLAGDEFRPWAIDSRRLMAVFGDRLEQLAADLASIPEHRDPQLDTGDPSADAGELSGG